jgi:translation elongation factor EF-Tu-like GTPase
MSILVVYGRSTLGEKIIRKVLQRQDDVPCVVSFLNTVDNVEVIALVQAEVEETLESIEQLADEIPFSVGAAVVALNAIEMKVAGSRKRFLEKPFLLTSPMPSTTWLHGMNLLLKALVTKNNQL